MTVFWITFFVFAAPVFLLIAWAEALAGAAGAKSSGYQVIWIPIVVGLLAGLIATGIADLIGMLFN